jgi:GrpB-like predicted nucleotidyltransferase (UPF0157 family)
VNSSTPYDTAYQITNTPINSATAPANAMNNCHIGAHHRTIRARVHARRYDRRMPADAPVEIVPYDPGWPHRFDDEAQRLRDVLRPWLAGSIEHIGSTAVPGLAAKPVVDIMAGVESLDASRPAIAALTDVGYCYAPYKADAEHWFCKPSPAFRTHHLHLVPIVSPQWSRTLAFREYLRTNPDIAAEYADLKRRLAEQYHFDREAYTAAKHPFIDRISALALRA